MKYLLIVPNPKEPESKEHSEEQGWMNRSKDFHHKYMIHGLQPVSMSSNQSLQVDILLPKELQVWS